MTQLTAVKAVGLTLRLKVLASIGIIGATAGTASLATFGTFTSSTTAAQTVSAGTVSLGENGTGFTNTLTVAASSLVPGDTVYRAFTLANTSSSTLASVTVSVANSTPNVLSTGANGLTVGLQECSTAWAESGHVYTCSGTIQNAVTAVALASLGTATLASPSTVTANGNHSMLLTMTLPTAADSTYAGLSAALTYTFTGTQRAATTTN